MGGRKGRPPPQCLPRDALGLLPELAAASPALLTLAGLSVSDTSAVQDEVTGLCLHVDEQQTVEVNTAKPAFIHRTDY